jgi:hypothetical protein
LLCMTPTVIPSMFQLIFHHLSKVRSSFQVLRVGGAYIGTIYLRSMFHEVMSHFC